MDRIDRIDLGEIENLLVRHPSVEKCVVVREKTSRRRMVAYVVGHSLAAAGLRAYLAERLPVWMVPDVFVELYDLPLARDGSVDRRALPLLPEDDDTDLWSREG